MLEEKIGFVEASIGRMVPIVAPEVRANDPLYVEVEAYSELPVDGDAFRAPIPAIRNLKPISPFQAYVERKLYVHNAGHAATAYLGWLKGYEFIWQAIQDRTIRSVVFDAMTESCRGLAKRFSMSEVALEMHRDDLLRRFGNRALGDQIVRVAADPIRKLGPEDRFFGAISMCLELGIPPVGLVKGVAAALQFDNPKDEAAMALQTRLREQGIDAVIRSMAPSEAVAEVVLEAISR
jgi:mannitol-1-phosphate 5-dehydrogenase